MYQRPQAAERARALPEQPAGIENGIHLLGSRDSAVESSRTISGRILTVEDAAQTVGGKQRKLTPTPIKFRRSRHDCPKQRSIPATPDRMQTRQAHSRGVCRSSVKSLGNTILQEKQVHRKQGGCGTSTQQTHAGAWTFVQ